MAAPRQYRVTRDVTPDECHWLDNTIPAGTIVERFNGCTYGCISSNGMAVTLEPGGPFVDLPRPALAQEGGRSDG